VSGRGKARVLGRVLREKRAALGLTLRAVVERCEKQHRPSQAYLHRLERGEIVTPSPFILHELSHALAIPYPTIMEAAGYVYPAGHEPPRPGLVVDALLAGDDLTADDRERLARQFERIARALRDADEPGRT
jgi:transcriptional regulator with XRE-family HTH domain